MKNKKDIYAYSCCMVLGLVIMGLTLSMEQFESKIFPMILSCLIIALAVFGLISSNREGEKSGSAGRESESGEVARIKWSSGYPAICALLFGYFITIYGVGFMIASPLFVLTYTKLKGMKWSSSIGFCAIVAVLQYGIFVLGVGINLYPGLLFE